MKTKDLKRVADDDFRQRIVIGLMAVLLASTFGDHLVPNVLAGERLQRGAKCLSDWSSASQIVRREKLAKIDEVARHVGKKGARGVLKTRLCQDVGANGKPIFAYELVVRGQSGRLKRMRLDAKTLKRLGE